MFTLKFKQMMYFDIKLPITQKITFFPNRQNIKIKYNEK